MSEPHDEPELPGASGQTAGDVSGSGVVVGTGVSVATSVPQTAPTTGRKAFRALRRELTQEDLNHPGVAKLLLEALEQAESRCEALERYVEMFHGADKRAAVLQTGQATNASIETAFGVALGLGGTFIGLCPSLWSVKVNDAAFVGPVVLAAGVVLVLGGVLIRWIKR